MSYPWQFYNFDVMCERLGISLEAMLEIVGEVLKEGTDALDEAGIPYWLSAGTALGLYRDGNLLGGDSDIDLGVTGDVLVDKIEASMLGADFMTQKYHNNKGVPQQRAYVKNGIPVDISIFHANGEHYIFHVPNGVIKKPKHLLENFHITSFNGKEYRIPSPREYLTWRYGDWETPSDSKGVYDNP